MEDLKVSVDEGMCDHVCAVIQAVTTSGTIAATMTVPKAQVQALIDDLKAYLEEG